MTRPLSNLSLSKKLAVLGVAAAVCTLPLVGIADVPNTFSDGDTINAEDFNANFASLDADIADIRAGDIDGMAGIGSIIAHTTHGDGSTSIDEMRTRGFAVCDGSTPDAQGIRGAVLLGATPALNDNGRFLRGGSSSGTAQSDTTADNGLALDDPGHLHRSRVSDGPGFCNALEGQSSTELAGVAADWDYPVDHGCNYNTDTTETGVTLSSTDAETRPVNMSVIWMIRVR